MKLLESLLQNKRILIASALIRPTDRILDIGCGNKALLRKLPNKQAVGIDKREGIDASKGLSYPADCFDCVTMLAVIEHITDYQKVLSEVYRVLAPGGMILITTPSPWGKWILELLAAMNLLEREQIRDHKHYFYPRSFIKDLQRAGFIHIVHRPFLGGFNNCYYAYK